MRPAIPILSLVLAGCAGGMLAGEEQSFFLHPQPKPESACAPRADFASRGIKSVAVAGFTPSVERKSDAFTPPPVFNAPPIPVYKYLANDGDAAAGAVEKALLDRQGYTVIERRRLEELIEELEIQVSGLVDPRKAAELGKMAGADAVLFGEVLQARSQLEYKSGQNNFVGVYTAAAGLRLRMTEVETGEVVWSCSIARDSVNYLEAPVEVSNRILARNHRFWDAPLRGSTPEERIVSVLESAAQDAVSALP